MSRREGRDSDPKRRDSVFDREPSLNRSRRDGKQQRERYRVTSSVNLDNGDHMDRDQKHHRQPREEAGALNKNSETKLSDHHGAPKHSSYPTEVPRSRSYFQRDEQGSARQVGRRATGERGWWKDSRDQHNQRTETNHSREQRYEKSQAKPDDNTFRRKDVLSDRKDDLPPTTKKRPAFREKKVPRDKGDANPTAAETVKPSQTDNLQERNERSSNPCHLERPEKQYAGDRAPNKGGAWRDGFSLKRRYEGSGGHGNYMGRDRSNGRQGYHPSNTRIEKWKHDLYQEVNNDPIPKSEDEKIAKLEALLAS